MTVPPTRASLFITCLNDTLFHTLFPQTGRAVVTAILLVPVTPVSGPSAGSDIEPERVEGVHGPRHRPVLTVDNG